MKNFHDTEDNMIKMYLEGTLSEQDFDHVFM
jgi:hypothetical protein